MDTNLWHTIISQALHEMNRERNKPLTVAVMGQTGVGKSSLVNALFNTNLPTDAIRPCTDRGNEL